ncbi:MAG: serpin family protein, partial [Verrucomicrobiota bacterium]
MKALLLFLLPFLMIHCTASAGATAAQAVNEGGLRIFRAVDRKDGNICLSPYSIQAALAMTYAGARGTTMSQMAAALGFPENPAELADGFDEFDARSLRRGRRGLDLLAGELGDLRDLGIDLRPDVLDLSCDPVDLLCHCVDRDDGLLEGFVERLVRGGRRERSVFGLLLDREQRGEVPERSGRCVERFDQQHDAFHVLEFGGEHRRAAAPDDHH